VEEIPNRFDFGKHLFAITFELSHRATVATPPEDHEHRREETHAAPHNQHGPVECQAAVHEKQGIESQEAYRERRERPTRSRGTLGHDQCTGWRRAGRTMNGAFGAAPSEASDADSSST
jgi:hypothetical protein